MVDGDNSVSKVLDRLRMYRVALVIHEGFRTRRFKSFVNYNGHRIQSRHIMKRSNTVETVLSPAIVIYNGF